MPLYNKRTYWQMKLLLIIIPFQVVYIPRAQVLHAHLSPPENMLLYQPPRWCDMVLPNWTLTFPMLGSLGYPEPSLIPSHQAPMASTSYWHHNLAWVCVGNMPIEPLHSIFSLIRSKLISSNPLLLLGLKDFILRVGNPVSKGMTVSAP